ncbi:MAG: amidophosphoribosyltransferase [Bacteroidetes bacterium]|nr:amidophosphoribosyltransferase [Bacteroidota bacterium]
MSDPILHECGLAALRLRKPLSHYQKKYGSALWGLNKMFLLMEKQHNRGQDGAGLATLKLDVLPGEPYIERIRIVEPAPPWQSLIKEVDRRLKAVLREHPEAADDAKLMRRLFPFAGEVMLGHLRYATHGVNSMEACHPVLRENNWKSRTLLVAGNFNLTNVSELFAKMVSLGQHPRLNTDTVTVLERMGHFLDEHIEDLYHEFKRQGKKKQEISPFISQEMDLGYVLGRAAKRWDGGYVMGGMVGTGHLFVLRDPWGIRPASYYINDDVVAIASERQAIATTFNIPIAEIPELLPGQAIIVSPEGKPTLVQVQEPQSRHSCSFERIYFSRGSDPDIYQERKLLGANVVPQVLQAVDYDLDNTVFSYIPNTAMVAFEGMVRGLEDHLDKQKAEALAALQGSDPERIRAIIGHRVRVESVIQKDTKLRTFITNDSDREGMAAHVYDVTHSVIRPRLDAVVCIDDSIVRGTTLRQSILRMLARLEPRRIVIVSSAPQIRYPDCYGIDMSQIQNFVAFQAAVALLKDSGQKKLVKEVYKLAKKALENGLAEEQNYVKRIYEPFTTEQISAKIAELLDPRLGPEVRVVYQTLEGLHAAIPHHSGDWYFTGNYPTPGGNRVVNRAYVNWVEGTDARAY